MGYVQRSLAPGERILYRTKLHPVIFVWPILFFLIAGVAFKSGFEVAAQIFFSLALLTTFLVVETYLRSEFAVTNRRVMGKNAAGYVPMYPEVALVELRTPKFKTGLLSSLFDYGTVVITDRHGATHRYPGVPAEFYTHVQTRDKRVRRILR